MVRNGDFSRGLDSWLKSDHGEVIVEDEECVIDGAYAFISQNVQGFHSSRRYRVSCRAWPSSGAGELVLNKVGGRHYELRLDPLGDWTDYSGEFDVDPGITALEVRAQHSSGRNLLIDDISITQIVEAPELLRNGDFEQKNAFWEPNFEAGYCEVPVGAAAIQIVDIASIPGTYRLVADCRADNGTGRIELRAMPSNVTAEITFTDGEWRQREVTLSPPTGDTRIRVSLQCIAGDGHAVFDTVSLKKHG
jgi:hypothetical protein